MKIRGFLAYSVLKAALLMTVCVSASAADFSSCSYELDRLRKAARDASDKASDAHSKQGDLESCKRDQQYNRRDCSSANSYLQSAVNDLSSELDTVSRRIKSVSAECTVGNGSGGGSQTGDPSCDLYRSYLGRLPFKTIMEYCTPTRGEATCQACLSFKPTVQGK